MIRATRLAGILVLVAVSFAKAQTSLISAQWTPPGSVPTTSGSGTLLIGNTIGLTTAAIGNAGAVFNWDWSALPFANGLTLNNTTNSGIAIAVGGNSTATQTLTFSSAISSPYLWFNYIDQNTSFSFGSYDWTLLSANGAARSGNSVNVTASASNLADSGFLVRINQDFGPSSSLTFNYISTSLASTSGFTVATVPEPSAFSLLAVGLGVVLRRRRRAV